MADLNQEMEQTLEFGLNYYLDLFDIKEYKLCGENRLFYFIDDGMRVVNCILFKNSHIETKKNRR